MPALPAPTMAIDFDGACGGGVDSGVTCVGADTDQGRTSGPGTEGFNQRVNDSADSSSCVSCTIASGVQARRGFYDHGSSALSALY